jgi:hypothetical protein
MYVEFGVEGASVQSVNEFRYEGKGAHISYGPLVDWSIILYQLKFPILLLDKEEACFVGTLQWSDSALLGVLYYEFV